MPLETRRIRPIYRQIPPFQVIPRMNSEVFHGTTILSVRRGNVVALGGDGQVTLGNVVVKATARKIRRL